MPSAFWKRRGSALIQVGLVHTSNKNAETFSAIECPSHSSLRCRSFVVLSSQVSTLVFGGLHLPAVPGEGLLDEGLDSRVSVSCAALKDEACLLSNVWLIM